MRKHIAMLTPLIAALIAAGCTGDDTLVGSAGNDLLSGGGGADLLIGGAGGDYLFGDADYQPDSAWVNGIGDKNGEIFNWTVTENPDGTCSISSIFWEYVWNNVTYIHSIEVPTDSGNDVIYAGAGDDRVWAGAGEDVVYGEDGNDRLDGQGGNDMLFGGAGDDTLFGDGQTTNSGNDYLDGEDGNDTEERMTA